MLYDAELPSLHERRDEAHKGDFGKVLVIAGSARMPGAACLTAESVLRSGAGLATLAVPRGILPVVAAKLTCSTFLPVPETSDGALSLAAEDLLLDAARGFSAIALGPGIGQHPETAQLARKLAARTEQPLVLDADGLNAFAGRAWQFGRRTLPLVITPHAGEMARLTGTSAGAVQERREAIAIGFAQEKACVVVLKGCRTVVTDGHRTYVNSTGNPGMATGGSGDVLTGVIASLIGQGLPPYDAAKLGSYVHGLAGDIAADEVGETSLIATDILASLQAAFRKHAASDK